MRKPFDRNQIEMIELHWREVLISIISFVFLKKLFQTLSPEFMELSFKSMPVYIPLFVVASYLTGIVFCKDHSKVNDLTEDGESAEAKMKNTSNLQKLGFGILYYLAQYAICQLIFPKFLEYKVFGMDYYHFLFILNVWVIYQIYKRINKKLL